MNTFPSWPPAPWTVVVNGAGEKRAFNGHTSAVGPWRNTYADATRDIQHAFDFGKLVKVLT